MLFEYCAENFTNIEAALRAGADRIELCDNLAQGGTTPSAGVIEQAVRIVREHEGAELRVIIRPRRGNFDYSKAEMRAMETDIRYAGANGVDGVVLGCLKRRSKGKGFELDLDATGRLVKVAQGVGEMRGRELGITFHMAFDALDEAEQLTAIDALAELGVDHILTHGGPANTSIEDNYEHLRALIARAGDRLTILPAAVSPQRTRSKSRVPWASMSCTAPRSSSSSRVPRRIGPFVPAVRPSARPRESWRVPPTTPAAAGTKSRT